MGNIESAGKEITRHDFHSCLLPAKCVRSQKDICKQIYAGTNLPPAFLLSPAAQYSSWMDINFIPSRNLTSGKSGAILLIGKLRTTRTPAVLKIWGNAFSSLEPNTLGDERPFRELYTQCALNGEPGFNCLGCFGVAPWPNMWIGRYGFDSNGVFGPKEAGKVLNAEKFPDFHPQRVLFMLTNVAPGAPLMNLPINQYKQSFLRGMALQIVATWQRAQAKLGQDWSHSDFHPDNLFIDPSNPSESPLTLPQGLSLEFPTVTIIDFDIATSDRFPKPIAGTVSSLGIRERTIQWLMRWFPLESVIHLLALYSVLGRLRMINRDFWHLLSYALVAEAYRDGVAARTAGELHAFILEKTQQLIDVSQQLVADAGSLILGQLLTNPLDPEHSVLPSGAIYSEIAGEGIALVIEFLVALGWIRKDQIRIGRGKASKLVSLRSRATNTFSELPAVGFFLRSWKDIQKQLTKQTNITSSPSLSILGPSVFASSYRIIPQALLSQWNKEFAKAVESYHSKTGHFPAFDDFGLQVRNSTDLESQDERRAALVGTLSLPGTGIVRAILPTLETLNLTLTFHQLFPKLLLKSSLTILVSWLELKSFIAGLALEAGRSWFDPIVQFFTGLSPNRPTEDFKLEILPWQREEGSQYLGIVVEELSFYLEGNRPIISGLLDLTEFVQTLGLEWLQKLLLNRYSDRLILFTEKLTGRNKVRFRWPLPEGPPHPCFDIVIKLLSGIPYIPAILGCHTFFQQNLLDLFKANTNSTVQFQPSQLLSLLPRSVSISFILTDGEESEFSPKIVESITLAKLTPDTLFLY